MKGKAARKGLSRRRGWTTAIVAVVAVVATVTLARRSSGPPASAPPSRVDWPAGKEQVYSLSWSTSTETTGLTASEGEGQDALRSLVELDGELVLASYGKKEAGYLLTARFEHLTRATVRALDQTLLPSLDAARGELEGHTAELTVTASGDVSDVRFHAKDPALFRYLMQAVLTELAVDVRDGTAWQAEIDGPSGHGPVRFARDGGVVTRTRERYDTLSAWPLAQEPLDQSLTSAGQLKLEPSGVIGELHDEEHLEATRPLRATAKKDVVSKTSFALTRKAERPFDASTLPVGLDQPVRPEEDAASETPEQHRARLEARTEGVTLERIVDDIRIHSAVPKGQSGRWAWIAEGYFDLYPEKTEALVDQMSTLDVNGKAYAIDVLVMVGHAQAQAAARRAFREKIIAPGVEYALMIQRLQHLNHPSQETADFVASQYTAAKGRNDTPARYATAITLGGVVHHLAETDRLAARKLDDALVLDLFAAKDPRDAEVLLLALGNAALEEDAVVIRLKAHDDSSKVRGAVAGALRRFDGPEIRTTLLDLFGDADDTVQREALSSLDRRELTHAELAAMLAILQQGKVPRGNVQSLANFIAPRREDGPEIEAMLDALRERTDLDAQTMGRLERIASRGQ